MRRPIPATPRLCCAVGFAQMSKSSKEAKGSWKRARAVMGPAPAGAGLEELRDLPGRRAMCAGASIGMSGVGFVELGEAGSRYQGAGRSGVGRAPFVREGFWGARAPPRASGAGKRRVPPSATRSCLAPPLSTPVEGARPHSRRILRDAACPPQRADPERGASRPACGPEGPRFPVRGGSETVMASRPSIGIVLEGAHRTPPAPRKQSCAPPGWLFAVEGRGLALAAMATV